jgi:hypothetical protein
MSSETVCKVARRWVDVGGFHTRVVVKFMIFAASVWNILDIFTLWRFRKQIPEPNLNVHTVGPHTPIIFFIIFLI